MKIPSSFPTIQSPWHLPFKAFAALAISGAAYAQEGASMRDDRAWLQSKGTLLFEDTFQREETGNGRLDIGNGWESATADRAPQVKQAMASTSTTMRASPRAAPHCASGFPV